MTSAARPKRREDVRLERFDEEALLYSPTSRIGVWLNPTATLIWELCDGKRTVADIVALLEQSYAVGAARLEEEVQAALGHLVEHGVIVAQ